MSGLTDDQQIKLMLVTLCEYLQSPQISDAQLLMYTEDLRDLGPERLAQAIMALKQDPSIWSGRFPLPAKLKQYLTRDIRGIALESVKKIMALNSVGQAFTELNAWELEAARAYGLRSIVERSPDQAPTIFAQLRDSLIAGLEEQKRKGELLGLPKTSPVALPEKA